MNELLFYSSDREADDHIEIENDLDSDYDDSVADSDLTPDANEEEAFIESELLNMWSGPPATSQIQKRQNRTFDLSQAELSAACTSVSKDYYKQCKQWIIFRYLAHIPF